jgi:hypothetical protein
MKVKHGDYLSFDIPPKWVVDENDDSTSVYSSQGEGAITLSYYSVVSLQSSLEEHISIMAKKFIENNGITINRSFVLDTTQKDKIVLHGNGTTSDNSFISLWIVTKLPRIVLATYLYQTKTTEIKIAEKIVDSIKFR